MGSEMCIRDRRQHAVAGQLVAADCRVADLVVNGVLLEKSLAGNIAAQPMSSCSLTQAMDSL